MSTDELDEFCGEGFGEAVELVVEFLARIFPFFSLDKPLFFEMI